MINLVKNSLLSVTVATLIAGMSACSSGGGDGTSSDPSDGTNGGGTQQTVVSGVASVSGTIATATSGISSSSAFKALASLPQESDASATLVIDTNKNKEYGDSGDTVLTSLVQSDGSFDFGEIAVDTSGETKAELRVAKEGFAPYTKIITLADGKSISVLADAASTPLLTEVVKLSDIAPDGNLATSFLEIGTKQTSQGMTSYSTIRSLSEMKALADVPLDGDTRTKSIIPLGAVDTTVVTSITAQTQTFDPTDEEDAQKFPGEYVGVGEPGQGEQRLVSVGFDYMALTDQNGDPVELDLDRVQASSKLLPQAVDYTSCLRTSVSYLSGAQLDLFKKYGDDDNTTDEFEVPLWFYNSSAGNWQYLGQAEVYENRDLNVNYSATSTASVAYAKMCITEQWGTSVNLDYSFTPQEPVNVCVVAKDQNSKAISNLSITAQKDTARDTVTLDREGKAKLALLADNNVNSYTFYYRGSLTGWNSIDVQSDEISAGGAEGCDNTINLELVNPYSATLKITAKELDGSAAANKYVTVYNSAVGDYFHKYAYTDANGEAEINVKPSTDYKVSYKGEVADVNIDATTNTPETADDGRVAVVLVQEQEQSPEVLVYMSNRSISDTAKSVNFQLSASDSNGDTVTLRSIKLSGSSALIEGTDYEVIRRYSSSGYETLYGKLNLESATLKAITPQALSAGTYSLEATYSDGKGEGTGSQKFTVNANRAPIISSVYLYNQNQGWRYINSKIEADTYELSAYIYDPDGDNITATYTLDGSAVSDLSSVVITNGNHTLEVNATDQTLSASKRFEFFVGNNPPEITSFGATKYSIDLASSETTVRLFAYVQDKDGDSVTVKTTDGTVTLVPSYNGSNYFRSEDITIDANRTFVIYANDGETNSSVASLDITTYTANQAPIFDTELTAVQVAKGTSYEFTCSATDPEGDSVTYEWLVGDAVQSATGTTFSYTFNDSATVTCRASDANTLEPGVATTSASVTTYDASAVGSLVVNTLPGAVVATHNSTTLAVTQTKVAGDNGSVTFDVTGTDRVTFSISLAPDIAVNKEAMFTAVLSELNSQLRDTLCNEQMSDTLPAACSQYNSSTFMQSSSIPNALADVVLSTSNESASDIDTNANGSIDSNEVYAYTLMMDDVNSDGVLSWAEFNDVTQVKSEFFVNVPVGEYDIDLYAHEYVGYIDDGYYTDEEWSYASSVINFSGFIENTIIALSNYWTNAVVGADGNASLHDAKLSGLNSLYSFVMSYIDENNATKYLLELDKTEAEVASLAYTPSDFSLTGSEVAFTVRESEFLSVFSQYKNQYIEGVTSSYNPVDVMLNNSALSYTLQGGINSTDPVTGAYIYKSHNRYYGDGTLQASYDGSDYPYLNVAVSLSGEDTVNFSGSDLSKVTYAVIDYYASSQEASVNVSFNYTIVPSSVTLPDFTKVLPSSIASALPQSVTVESISINVTEYKGVDETAFIDAITTYDYSFYNSGSRSLSAYVNLNQNIAAMSTLKSNPMHRSIKPFSIGIEPRSFVSE